MARRAEKFGPRALIDRVRQRVGRARPQRLGEAPIDFDLNPPRPRPVDVEETVSGEIKVDLAAHFRLEERRTRRQERIIAAEPPFDPGVDPSGAFRAQIGVRRDPELVEIQLKERRRAESLAPARAEDPALNSRPRRRDARGRRAFEIRELVAPRAGGENKPVQRLGLDDAEQSARRRAFIDARNVDRRRFGFGAADEPKAVRQGNIRDIIRSQTIALGGEGFGASILVAAIDCGVGDGQGAVKPLIAAPVSMAQDAGERIVLRVLRFERVGERERRRREAVYPGARVAEARGRLRAPDAADLRPPAQRRGERAKSVGFSAASGARNSIRANAGDGRAKKCLAVSDRRRCAAARRAEGAALHKRRQRRARPHGADRHDAADRVGAV